MALDPIIGAISQLRELLNVSALAKLNRITLGLRPSKIHPGSKIWFSLPPFISVHEAAPDDDSDK
jgi:hypothetical protein